MKICLALALIACCACRSSPPVEMIPVRVVVTPRLGSAPLHIAKAEGLFARHGLDVELVEMSRSVDAMAALGQGRFDVSGGAVNAGLLNAMARGVPIRIVAGMGVAPPDDCTGFAIVGGEPWTPALLNRPSRPLRISADATQFTGFMLDLHLARAGGSVGDVVLEDVTEPLELQALKERQIDAAFVGEPWLTRMIEDGSVHVWARIEELMADSQVGSMWYGPTFLTENPETGRRFMAAYLEGVRQYIQGPTQRNLEIVSQFTGLDVAELRSVCWSPVQPDGRVHVASLRQFRDWLVERGTLPPADQPIADDDLIDGSFVEWANANRLDD